MQYRIITVGREFGSGGREFGRRLAEELHIEYYDREIITEIARHTSLSEEYVRQVVEQKPHRLYPITIGQSLAYQEAYPMRQLQAVYQAQSSILHEMAAKSPCVIVGRCADYILRDEKPFRIFVYADLDSRVRRCMDRAPKNEEAMDERQMRKYIQRVDRDRAKYYNEYTDREWGDRSNYDLCINTTDVVIKEIVPCIAKLFI